MKCGTFITFPDDDHLPFVTGKLKLKPDRPHPRDHLTDGQMDGQMEDATKSLSPSFVDNDRSTYQ